MSVTDKFKEDTSRAAIRALRGLETTAIMLEKYAPDIFPEVNVVNGVEQRHFGRIMMESAAEAIRRAWANAIADAENSSRAEQIASECGVTYEGDDFVCRVALTNECNNDVVVSAGRYFARSEAEYDAVLLCIKGPHSVSTNRITRKEAEALHVVLGRALVGHDDA